LFSLPFSQDQVEHFEISSENMMLAISKAIEDPPLSTRKSIGWSALGVGVASGITGILLSLSARSLHAERLL